MIWDLSVEKSEHLHVQEDKEWDLALFRWSAALGNYVILPLST